MKRISNYNPKKIPNIKNQNHFKDKLKLTPLQKAKTSMVYLLLIFWSFIILLPITGILIGSFNVSSENYINFDNIILGFDNFKKLFDIESGMYFGFWISNSLFVSTFTMGLTLIFVSLTGYAYSRFRFKGRRISIMVIMLIQMIPSIMALIALYIISELLYSALNIIPLLTLIIIYSGGSIAGNTFVLKGYLDSISSEIDDSAKMDGSGNIKTYFKIIMPLAKPMLVIIMLWSFIGPFGDVILPKILLNNPISFTLPLGLYSLLQPDSNRDIFEPVYAAGALITTIPIASLFIYSQRHMINGLTTGGVKG